MTSKIMPASVTHWSVSHGLSGYLSGSDDVTAWLSWTDARAALIADMRDYADTDDDATWDTLTMTVPASDYPSHEDGSPDYGDDAPSMLATVDAMITDGDVAPFADAEWIGTVEDGDGRTIWFGLSRHDSSECDGMCEVVDGDS
jgi:hypothetical protein